MDWLNAMGEGLNKPTVKDGTVFAEGGGLVDWKYVWWSRLDWKYIIKWWFK